MTKILFFIITIMACNVGSASSFVDVCDRGVLGKLIVDKTKSLNCFQVDSEKMSAIKQLTLISFTRIAETIKPNEDYLHGLDSLQQLNVAFDQDVFLPENFFKDNKELDSLILGSRGSLQVSSKVFQGLSKLRSLGLEGSSYFYSAPLFVGENIPESLSNLTSLKSLILKGVNIFNPDVGQNLFSKLIEVEELFISWHSISQQSEDTINRVSRMLSAMEGVKKVFIFDKLDGVPEFLNNFKLLESLKIDFRRPSTFSIDNPNVDAGSFAGLNKLKELIIRIPIVPNFIFSDLNELEKLYITTYALSPNSLQGFDGIKVLSIKPVTTSIDGPVFQSVLNIENPKALSEMYLESSQFGGDLSSNIFSEFSNLKKMSIIQNVRVGSFNHNEFSTRVAMSSDWLKGLGSLEELNLSFYNDPELDYYTYLPEGVFKGLSLLKTVSLGGSSIITKPLSFTYLGLDANQTSLRGDNIRVAK